MNDRMMNTLQLQLDNVNKTIEGAKNAWRRDLEHEARLQWRADELTRMIENDIEPAKTAITFADVLRTREVVDEKSSACMKAKEKADAYADERHAACTEYIRAKHDGAPDSIVESLRKKYEGFAKTTDELSTARRELDKAELVQNKTTEIHTRQCEVIALRALLADLSWTKQPTRYKRMRTKAEAIANAALIGTGCRLDVYSGDGTMTIREDYAVSGRVPSREMDVDLSYTRCYTTEMPDIEAMTKRLTIYESDSEGSVTNVTVDDIINIVDDMYAIQDELRKLREEYVARAMDLIKPLERFGLREDTARVGSVDHYDLY